MNKRLIHIRRLTALLLLVFSSIASAEAVFSRVAKVVAVGDLHGDYEQYIRVLEANNLVNKKLKWAAGDIHFVQLGDVTDRGPDSFKIIRHLMKLEKQAKKAGGRVHVLIGNHEAMNIQTDLRFVHPGEYKALVTKHSKKKQARYLDTVFRSMLVNQPELADTASEIRTKLEKRFPLGYVEHRLLWEPGQELAKWYAGHNTVIQINNTIYLHGGLDPHVDTYRALEEINEMIGRELEPGGQPELSVSERGPLWYRGLAKNSADEELEALNRMLEFYNADRIMVAHSPTMGAVMPRFDRKVIVADVGISAHYGGALANVVSEKGQWYAVHRGRKIELPLDEGVDDYLKQVAALEPVGSKLAKYVQLKMANPAPKAAEMITID
ncbi:MAG: protein-tyrosine-phosphatase [Gammaproteobacteria bacterium]|jgi:hypothetical protein|nr:protein-tyrosine-phosphatase [Gammaproteobacteria bacterium]MBT4492484.1 protein-tyrosine-phosphatase [Gammaproteobacteria bacterium]MBT7371941.1 protein-tyrosine-phosphatase [Gammaproteobacteria bacterium]